jgi:hypothetical protein
MLYSRIEHSQSSLKLTFPSRQTQEGKAATDYVLHSSLRKALCRPICAILWPGRHQSLLVIADTLIIWTNVLDMHFVGEFRQGIYLFRGSACSRLDLAEVAVNHFLAAKIAKLILFNIHEPFVALRFTTGDC